MKNARNLSRILVSLLSLQLAGLSVGRSQTTAWWKNWPTFVNAPAPANLETIFRSHATTVTTFGSDEGRGAYYTDADLLREQSDITLLGHNEVLTLAWLEGMGTGRAKLGALKGIAGGSYEIDPRTGQPRLVGNNDTWTTDGVGSTGPGNPDANTGVWMGVHAWASRWNYQGTLVAPSVGTGGYADPTTWSGSSALDTGSSFLLNPLTSNFWLSMGSKGINGNLWLTPRYAAPSNNNNTDRVPYPAGQTTLVIGDMQIGKDTAAGGYTSTSWWVGYNNLAASRLLAAGYSGFWVDNYNGFDFMGLTPTNTAFGDWSVHQFNVYAANNSITLPGGFTTISQYLKDTFVTNATAPGNIFPTSANVNSPTDPSWSDPYWQTDAVWNAFKAYKSQTSRTQSSALYNGIKAAAVSAGLTADSVYVGANDVGNINYASLTGRELDTPNVEYAPASTKAVTRDAMTRTDRLPPYGHAGPFYSLLNNFGNGNNSVVWYYMSGIGDSANTADGFLGEVIGFEALAHNTVINTGLPTAVPPGPGMTASARKVNDVVANLGALFGARKPRAGIGLFFSEDSEYADLMPGGYLNPALDTVAIDHATYPHDDTEHTMGFFGWGEALEALHATYRTIASSQLTAANLASLSVLVLPNVTSISPASVVIIQQFVTNGGWLVITGSDSGSITDTAGRFVPNSGPLLWQMTTNPTYSAQIISNSTNLGKNYYVSTSSAGTAPNIARDAAQLAPIQAIINQLVSPGAGVTRVYYDPIASTLPATIDSNVMQDAVNSRMFVDLVNKNITNGTGTVTLTPTSATSITLRLPSWLPAASTQVRCISAVSPVGSGTYSGAYSNSYIGWQNAVASTVLSASGAGGNNITVNVPSFVAYCTLVCEPAGSTSGMGTGFIFPWLSDNFDADPIGSMPDSDWITFGGGSSTWAVDYSPQNVAWQNNPASPFAMIVANIAVNSGYTFSAKIDFSSSAGRIGLMADYVNSSNMYIAILNQDLRRLQLLRESGGVFTTLAQQSISGAFSFNKPNTVAITLGTLGGGGLPITVMLNGGAGGELTFTDPTPPVNGSGQLVGTVGLQTVNPSPSTENCQGWFDDALAQKTSDNSVLLADNFENATLNSMWTTVGTTGLWQIQGDGTGINRAFGQSDDTATAAMVIASPVYADETTLSTRVKINSSNAGLAKAGVVLRYRDGSNYYFVELDQASSTLSINKTVGGTASTLATASFTPQIGRWYDLNPIVTNSGTSANFSVSIDHVLVLTASDSSPISAGAVGLETSNAAVDFDKFASAKP